MRVAKVVFSVIVGALALLPASGVYAASPVNQLDSGTYVGNQTQLFNFGTTTQATTVNSISFVLSATNTPAVVYARVTCFANTWTPSQAGCASTAPVNSVGYLTGSASVNGDKQFTTFQFATSTLQFAVGKVYVVEILANSGSLTGIYGMATYRTAGDCKYAGTQYCSGTPYYQFNSSINWGALYIPLVFSTSSQAIATNSPLWGSLSTSSISQCNDNGNLFSTGLCLAGSYLFLPNPEALNAWAGLPSLIQTKFPFSWVIGVTSAFTDLTASSTQNMIAPSIAFHDLGMGSTTAFGNFLPNMTLISSSTIQTYMPSGFWDFVQGMIVFALWFGFALDVFFTVRNQMHRV